MELSAALLVAEYRALQPQGEVSLLHLANSKNHLDTKKPPARNPLQARATVKEAIAKR